MGIRTLPEVPLNEVRPPFHTPDESQLRNTLIHLHKVQVDTIQELIEHREVHTVE